jgi:inner membrane transporter RhtA
MALEPAIGVFLGLFVLHQEPSFTQIVGILLVVLAGGAAQHGGRRRARVTEGAPVPSDVDLTGHAAHRRPAKVAKA